MSVCEMPCALGNRRQCNEEAENRFLMVRRRWMCREGNRVRESVEDRTGLFGGVALGFKREPA